MTGPETQHSGEKTLAEKVNEIYLESVRLLRPRDESLKDEQKALAQAIGELSTAQLTEVLNGGMLPESAVEAAGEWTVKAGGIETLGHIRQEFGKRQNQTLRQMLEGKVVSVVLREDAPRSTISYVDGAGSMSAREVSEVSGTVAGADVWIGNLILKADRLPEGFIPHPAMLEFKHWDVRVVDILSGVQYVDLSIEEPTESESGA